MKKIFNFRPVVFLTAYLSLGILIAYLFLFGRYLFGGILSVFCVTPLVFFSVKGIKGKKKPLLIFSILFLIIAVIGGSTFSYKVKSYEDANLEGHILTFNGKITQINQSDYGAYLIVSGVKVFGVYNGETGYKIALTVYGDTSRLDVGDNIAFSGSLNDNETVYDGKFASYRILNKAKYSTDISMEDIVVKERTRNIFERINLFIRDSLKKGLDEETFPVGYALLTGTTDSMEEDTLENFRNAGVAHIFAVSGLHIGFLVFIISFILKIFKCNDILRAIVTVTLCVLYSGVCGFSASSLRATIMASVLFFSNIRGERYDGLSTISLSALIILLINPVHLFCVGFLLSFSVVFGISVLSRPIANLFKIFPRRIATAIGTTLSAELVSFPVSLYFFGKFSLIAVIANLLFIPVVGVIYIILFFATLLTLIIPETVMLFIPKYLLKGITVLINAFDYKVFLIGGFSLAGFTLVYYLCLIIPSGIINLKRKLKVILTVTLCSVFIVGTTVYNIADNRVSVWVSGSPSFCATMISKKGTDLMVVSKANYIFSHYGVARAIEKRQTDGIDCLIVLSQSGGDLQVLLTKICGITTVKKVITADEIPSDIKSVVMRSFPDIIIESGYKGNKEIEIGNIVGKITFGGACFEMEKQGLAVFGRTEYGIHLTDSKKEYKSIVAYDNAREIFGYYNPKNAVSYLPCGSYKNAVSGGNALFYS